MHSTKPHRWDASRSPKSGQVIQHLAFVPELRANSVRAGNHALPHLAMRGGKAWRYRVVEGKWLLNALVRTLDPIGEFASTRDFRNPTSKGQVARSLS